MPWVVADSCGCPVESSQQGPGWMARDSEEGTLTAWALPRSIWKAELAERMRVGETGCALHPPTPTSNRLSGGSWPDQGLARPALGARAAEGPHFHPQWSGSPISALLTAPSPAAFNLV